LTETETLLVLLAAENFSVPWFYSLIKSRLINLSYCEC